MAPKRSISPVFDRLDRSGADVDLLRDLLRRKFHTDVSYYFSFPVVQSDLRVQAWNDLGAGVGLFQQDTVDKIIQVVSFCGDLDDRSFDLCRVRAFGEGIHWRRSPSYD